MIKYYQNLYVLLPNLIIGGGKTYKISYSFYETITVETKDAFAQPVNIFQIINVIIVMLEHFLNPELLPVLPVQLEPILIKVPAVV